jgi:anti-sigma-K factor RskA
MSIDLSTRELTVRPITAQSQPGRTYQLWIASDQLGPAPRSLGLLDQPGEPTSKTLTEFDRDLLQKATFGISLEPEGGSPTGRPTSPALHGTLYPAKP